MIKSWTSYVNHKVHIYSDAGENYTVYCKKKFPTYVVPLTTVIRNNYPYDLCLKCTNSKEFQMELLKRL